jgi:hypothetical protein
LKILGGKLPGKVGGCRIQNADVAQLAEQLTCNQQVNGSSPFIGFFLILEIIQDLL